MRVSRGHVGRALGLVFAVGVGIGCAETKRDARWSAKVDTLSSGAVRVSYRPPASEVPGWTLAEELRIGGAEADGPAAFGSIKGLQVLSDANLAVLDAMAREVRIFGSDGQHLATFGGEGGGPGEFLEPFGLMQDSSGRLWIPDFRAARMSVIDPAAGFQESFPLKLLQYAFIWDGAMTRDDRILEPSITLGPPRRNILRVHDQRMDVVDSLPLPDDPAYDPTDPPGSYYWEAPGGRERAFFRIRGFPLGERLFDGRGRVWSTELGDFGYRIKHWQPGEDTLLVLEARREPVPVPAPERESVISGLREQLKRLGAADQDWSKVPRRRPSVLSLSLSDEGDLWVETPAPDGSTVFDRFNADGTYLGSVASGLKLASGIRPIIRGDQLWAVVTGELDVQYVVRARMIPASWRRG